MEPTIRHLPLIDHASGIQNLDRRRQLEAARDARENFIIGVMFAFTAGLVVGILINN